MSGEESQFNVQGYNIVTILKRLEAATSRLEDITIFQEEASRNELGDTSTGADVLAENQQKSLETSAAAAAAAFPTSGPNGKSPASSAEPAEKSKQLQSFELFIEEHIVPFVEISNQIDSLVGESATYFGDAFKAQAKFLALVDQAKKPDASDPQFLLAIKPINEQIEKINNLKEANRRSEFFNHLNAISDGAPVLGWFLTPAPLSAITEFKDSAQFWSNRALKEFKEKDPKYSEWAKKFSSIFDSLKPFVKEFHTTGPSWNNKTGRPLGEVLKAQAPASSIPPAPPAPGAAGGPPPPPPPPPSSIFEDSPSASGSISTSSGGGAGSMNAVFADLNKGENVTSGLKKVDKSEMTHKNPSLRQNAAVATKKPTPPKKPTNLSSTNSSPTVPKKKPARKELIDGTKWIIENFTEQDISNNTPIIIEAEMHQSIFIGNTDGITVQVKGKANAISLSETKNTGVVVDSLISGIDVIKSYRYGLQVLEVVPMISIDKSDEGTIYLSKTSVEADTQIYTSSTTALNVNVPSEDDYSELAVPEQFKHTIKNGQLVSEVVEHAG